MGARQSKRSVDITTTPKKGDGEIIAEGEGKLEKIGDADVKVATNGTVPHNEEETGVSISLSLVKCFFFSLCQRAALHCDKTNTSVSKSKCLQNPE